MTDPAVTVVDAVTQVAVEQAVTVVVVESGVPGDPPGTAANLVAAHEAEVDPHPLYLNESRAAALHAPIVHVHGMGDISGIADALAAKADTSALAAKLDASAVNAANGVAGLDANSKLNPLHLPALAITDTYLVASQAAMLATGADVGDVAIRSDINKTFILRASPATTLANWSEILTPTTGVSSVFGRTGAVTAQPNDYTFAQIGSKPTTVAGYGITDGATLGANTFAGHQTINGFALRVQGWGGVAGDGVVYFGIGDEYIFKSGTSWIFRANGASVTLTGAGAIWHSGNLNPHAKTAGGGIAFGSVVGANVADLSKHIDLYGGAYGINVTSSTLGYHAAGGALHRWYIAGTKYAELGTGGFGARRLYQAAENDWSNYLQQPRVFVQAGDPGALASDGDLWIW